MRRCQQQHWDFYRYVSVHFLGVLITDTHQMKQVLWKPDRFFPVWRQKCWAERSRLFAFTSFRNTGCFTENKWETLRFRRRTGCRGCPEVGFINTNVIAVYLRNFFLLAQPNKWLIEQTNDNVICLLTVNKASFSRLQCFTEYHHWSDDLENNSIRGCLTVFSTTVLGE